LKPGWLLALVAAALHVALVLHGAARHSAVFDEVVYPAAGYATLRSGEVRLNREHPPLLKLLSGAMWLGTGLPVAQAPGWDPPDQWAFGRHLLYGRGRDAARLLARARLPMALLSGAMVVAVWAAARRLAGPVAGAAALVLISLDPLVVAHAGLATTDLGAAATLFAAVLALPWGLSRGGGGRLALAGAALGAALASKFSAVVLLLLLPALAWRGRDRLLLSLARVAAILATAALVVVLVYGRSGPLLWFEGMRMLAEHQRVGHPTYAFGQWSNQGWWWYFPAAWLVKTPLVLLVAQGLGVAWAWRRRDLLHRTWPLLALPALLGLAALSGTLNLGVRHLLPVSPCLAVLGGGAVAAVWEVERSRWRARGRTGVALAGLALAGGTLAAHPDELAYGNLLIGGTDRTWKVLSDSNVDWGQALPTLARQMSHQPVRRLYLAYFGSADPAAEGIAYVWLPTMNMIERRVAPEGDPGGREWLAVSVTALMDVYEQEHAAYAWLRPRRMTAFPGRSIALYDITGDPSAFERLGETALSLGDPAAALPTLQRAAELAPRAASVRLRLAEAWSGLGAAEPTARECAQAVALSGAAPAMVATCDALRREAIVRP